jgi:hypothetical protein
MPLARYFLVVGTALLALLFVIDACLPKLPAADNANSTVNVASDLSVIRIHSDRRWPERVEFDTSMPTITPAPAALAEVNVPANAAAPARMRDAFAQLETTQAQTPIQAQTSEPKKPEPKLPPKRRIVASKTVANRTVAKNQAGQPMMLVAQQPRFGFFSRTMW